MALVCSWAKRAVQRLRTRCRHGCVPMNSHRNLIVAEQLVHRGPPAAAVACARAPASPGATAHSPRAGPVGVRPPAVPLLPLQVAVDGKTVCGSATVRYDVRAKHMRVRHHCEQLEAMLRREIVQRPTRACGEMPPRSARPRPENTVRFEISVSLQPSIMWLGQSEYSSLRINKASLVLTATLRLAA
jgi:hypothetical protein